MSLALTFTTCYSNESNKNWFLKNRVIWEVDVHNLPGDSRSWESPEKADNAWRLFIHILLREIPDFSPGM